LGQHLPQRSRNDAHLGIEPAGLASGDDDANDCQRPHRIHDKPSHSERFGSEAARGRHDRAHRRQYYFDVGGGWRREPGGGPVLLNLTHEVNNLLSLIGDIDTVIALTSNSTRGFPVEDTAAMIFRFANGALGTFLLSDTAGSARSWEQTSRENTRYSSYDDEDAYHIAGTRGSLSVPTMRLKIFEAERSWWEPFTPSTESVERSDPLTGQVQHFVDVILGVAEPICSGRDGLKTMQVVDAVIESARSGRPVNIAN
jgi:predicted dehydrogenase